MAESSRLAAHRARSVASAADDFDPTHTQTETLPDAGANVAAGAGESTEENDMADTPDTAALDAARAEGFAAANQRFNAVLASEHFAGRETLAKTLLASDKLGADEVIAALAAAPAATPAAPSQNEDSDDAQAREDMRSKIAAEQADDTTETPARDEPATKADVILRDQAAFTGKSLK